MKEFGKMPNEWDKMPKEARAEAMAFVHMENMIESYQMQDVGKNND